MYNIKDTFLNFTNNMRIEPSVSFCFVSVFMLAGIDFIKDSFPPECEVIWLWGDCVAANVNPKREFLDVNVLCTFLPQIPNVEIKFFELLDVSTIKETHQYQDIINTIVKHKTSASNQETSSCFMLFCDFACYDVAQRWASAVQEGTENKVDSVCGGVLFRISTRNRLLLRCSAVLITGSIRTWSVILRMERGTTKEEVQTRLQSFKDKVNLKKYSIGFISVPVYSEKSNLVYVALKTFASLFPQTSLISYVSIDRNSFGKNTVDDVNEEKNDKDNDQFKKFNSWCTEGCFVFLLLTYG